MDENYIFILFEKNSMVNRGKWQADITFPNLKTKRGGI